MPNLNTATKGQLHGLREPAAVRNETYVSAAINDLQVAARLINDAAMHVVDVGLTEKQTSKLEKAARTILDVRSQLIRS
jgi:hypothetical protein